MKSVSLRHLSLTPWLAVVALVGCGGPMEGTPGSAGTGVSLEELTARSPEPVAVHRSAVTGAPESLYGVLSDGMTGISRTSAHEFLREHAAALQLDSVDQLELDRSFNSPMGTHYVFRQKYQGVPVDGAEVKVHYAADGRVVAVNSTFAAGASVKSVRPAVHADLALELAYVELGGRPMVAVHEFSPTTELVIHTATGAARLAWKVTVPTDGPTWEVVIDAQDGSTIAAPRDTNKYVVNGTGKVWSTANAVVSTHDNTLRDNNNSATAVPASAYATVTLPGLNGNGFLDGTYVSSSATKKRVSSSTNSFLYDRSSVGFEETMVYYNIDKTQRYIQSLGFTNANNRQQVYSANGTTQDNSWYTPNTKQITYGTGGVDDAEDAEVLVHEYGHSIQDNQVPGFGSSNEAGAQGEGFGDYLGATIGAQTSGGFQDTCIMEWDATFYSSTNPPCLRRLDSTKHYPESVDNEVHDDGEMWSSTLWNIRTAIGAARADKVVIQHHFLLTAGSTFSASANAMVTAARNLGYTSTECNAIRTNMLNRGFSVTVTCP